MTRKEFIAGSVAAVGAVVCGSEITHFPRLAFQGYAVRNLCEKDLLKTLKAAKDIGYEGIETGRFYGRSAEDWRVLCCDIGLDLVALQLYPHMLTEPELKETIQFCHKSGCHRINTAWFKGSAENSNDWQIVVNVLNHAVDICATEGIEIGYHNHDHELLARFEGKSALEWLYERFDPRVKQEFDPGWCTLAGQDPCAWLSRHPKRNPTIHVMPAIPEVEAKNLKPGEASVGSRHDRVNWDGFLSQAAVDGTGWFVVKPTLYPDSITDLAASFEYLTNRRRHTLNVSTHKA